MNKLFTKLAKVFLGLSLAAGVGVTIGSNREASKVDAAVTDVDVLPNATNTGSSATSYVTSTLSYTCGGATIKANQVNPSTLQIKVNQGNTTSLSASNFSLYNNTAFSDHITKITVTFNTAITRNYFQVHTSTSSALTSNQTYNTSYAGTQVGSTNQYKWEYDYSSGIDYFRLGCAKNGGTVKLTEFTVYYGQNASASLSFSTDSISGEVNDPFSFTWTEANLSNDITWSPTSASTEIIDYSVNTSTKTVSGTLKKAGTVTLTGTSGTVSDSVAFTVSEHETNRKYTVTSTSAVTESGDAITGSSSTFSNSYTTKDQMTSGSEQILTISGLTKNVHITKLVLSMHCNANGNGAGYVTIKIDTGSASYVEGNSSGTSFSNFGDDGQSSANNTYRDVVWEDNIDFTAKSSIQIVVHATANSLYCQSFSIYFEETENSDVVTALSVSPNSWTGYDSGTVTVSTYTVSVTTNGTTGSSSDYIFQGIGSGSGDGFTPRIADFTSGHPTTSDTRLQWKAKYPTTAGGSTYLYTYVTLNVTADSIDTISISGTMPADYSLGGSWSTTGLSVTANYLSGNTDTLTSNLTWNFYSDENMTNEVATPDDLGVGNTQTIYVKATYSGVTPSKVSAAYSQVVNVTKEPGVVNFGTASGAISMSSGAGSGYDTLSNSVTSSCNSTAYQSNSSSYVQVGSTSSPLTEWTTTVNFGSGQANRKSIESFEIQFAGSAGGSDSSYIAYTDGDENNLVLSGSVNGQNLLTQSTGNNYEIVNANSLTVKFTGSAYGVQLHYFSYQLGDPVQEFDTLVSIAIANRSSHNTIFKIDETFSTQGLVIIATDNVGFTKTYTSGFTTDYDGVTFDDTAEDVVVTVSLEIKGVTRTTTYTIDVIEIPVYTPISSQSELYEGMKVIIGHTGSLTALGSWNSSKTRFNIGTIAASSDVSGAYEATDAIEFTVRLYGQNLIMFQYGSLYLGGGSSGAASQQTTINESATWALTSTGLDWKGEGSMYMQKNTSNDIYACYPGSQNHVQIFVSSATPKDDIMGAESFAQKYLHMRDYDPELHVGVDGSGYCKDNDHNYYATAKAFYTSASFSNAEKVEFAKLTDAVARLQAWARAKGETFDPSAKTFSENPRVSLLNVMGEKTNSVAIIVIISMVSVTAIGGYFFLRKRKENI